MLLDPPRQCDLLTHLGTRRRRQLDLGQVSFDAKNSPASRRRADVEEEELVLGQLGDFCLLVVLRLDTEETAEKEETNFEF